MSSSALKLYWLTTKSYVTSYWKYAAAFALGSFASSIFSFFFVKSVTGKNTAELIWEYMVAKSKIKYRNIIKYDKFSIYPTPMRPSTDLISMDAMFRGWKAKSTIDYKTTSEEFCAVYKKYRKQNLAQRGKVSTLPSFCQKPKEIIIKKESANNSGPIKCYLLSYPGASINNGIIYYIHGGGSYLGYPEQGYAMLAVMMQYTGMVAMAIEYHFCPEISLPQQVDECIDGYKYILDTLKVDSKKVFITGESAGGYLTLLLLQKLNKLKLPQPLGGIPISAPCDCSWKTALKCEQDENIKDAMFAISPNYMTICIDNKHRNEYDNGNKDKICLLPEYSPLNGIWKGLCPLFVSASLNEALINDSKLIVEKCKEFGVECEYDFDPYLLHATFAWCKYIPEARDKLIICIEWMKKQLNKRK